MIMTLMVYLEKISDHRVSRSTIFEQYLKRFFQNSFKEINLIINNRQCECIVIAP
jgi:hypothetical protein